MASSRDVEAAVDEKIVERSHSHDTDASSSIDTDSIRSDHSSSATPRSLPRPETVFRTTSHVSGPDAFHPDTPLETLTPSQSRHRSIRNRSRSRSRARSYREAGDEVYDILSRRRKSLIVAVLSFCAFLSPMSSTTILAAVPEVAAEYNTTGSVINLSNAAYMALMGLSPIVWGPFSNVFGRWPITLLTAVLFFLLSLATALAPDLASFFVFRALSAFEGTAFILLGAACIGDIYRPTERGTAVGWFMSGTLIGPAFGPFIGGIIVTYSDWRTIFWLQAALAGTGALGVFFLVPETIHRKGLVDLDGQSRKDKTKAIVGLINPIRVLKLFRYWNLSLVAWGSSSLVWNMYTLLTPIRYVLNPRFNLESPLLSGLFYLAPGCGYLLGTFMGGRWADWTVKRWIRKRGERVPEDRLRSAVPFMGIVIPACILVYGWTIEESVGGIPVPVIVLFLQGVAQLFCFPALNTYCLDVMPGKGAEVTAANYFLRYILGCIGTAIVLPMIDAVGVGWFSTLSVGLLLLGTAGVMASIRWGRQWREAIDAKEKAAAKAKSVNRVKNDTKVSTAEIGVLPDASDSDEKGQMEKNLPQTLVLNGEKSKEEV